MSHHDQVSLDLRGVLRDVNQWIADEQRSLSPDPQFDQLADAVFQQRPGRVILTLGKRRTHAFRRRH